MCRQKCCNHWWILATIAIIIGLIGTGVIVVLRIFSDKPPIDYGIVIDAGSSHTSLYLYHWDGAKENNTGIVKEMDPCDANDSGISSFADKGNPEEAGSVLVKCLNKFKDKIPSIDHQNTPIFLGATAGMRILRAKNESAVKLIFQAIRKTISSYPFKFEDPQSQAKIITGKDEGAFAWITLNYLRQALVRVPTSVFNREKFKLSVNSAVEMMAGALDLGGASTQIAFLPPSVDSTVDNITSYFANMTLYGSDYSVYSHSFLCYGKNEADRRYRALLIQKSNFSALVRDPCRPQGNKLVTSFSRIFQKPCTLNDSGIPAAWKKHENSSFTLQGTSHGESCRVHVKSLFDSKCTQPDNKCSFNNIYQPSLYGNFTAFSAYYYVTSFLNLTQNGAFPLSDLISAVKRYCTLTWKEISQIPTTRKKNLPDYCFDGQYIHRILTYYGFTENNWESLSFRKKIDGASVGWTLGFMINATNSEPISLPLSYVTMILFIILLVLFAFFFLLAIIFGVLGCKESRIQSSQSKNDNTITRRNENYFTVPGSEETNITV